MMWDHQQAVRACILTQKNTHGKKFLSFRLRFFRSRPIAIAKRTVSSTHTLKWMSDWERVRTNKHIKHQQHIHNQQNSDWVRDNNNNKVKRAMMDCIVVGGRCGNKTCHQVRIRYQYSTDVIIFLISPQERILFIFIIVKCLFIDFSLFASIHSDQSYMWLYMSITRKHAYQW